MRETSGWRSVLPGGAWFPFAALLLAYALLDLAAACALHAAKAHDASPNHSEMGVTDGLGGAFRISDPSDWQFALFLAMALSTEVQRAVFAIWIAFGCGRWFTRLGVATSASACLYGAIRAQLSTPEESWQDVLVPVASMPLKILSLVMPFAILAILTGWRLRRENAPPDGVYSRRRFSISDVLLITAAVAVSLALARWRYVTYGADVDALAESSLLGLVFSTIYVLPIAWATLAVRRRPLAALLTGLLITAFGAFLFLTAASGSEFSWPMLSGFVCGALLTAPCSLLIWRACGYRLTRARRDDASKMAG